MSPNTAVILKEILSFRLGSVFSKKGNLSIEEIGFETFREESENFKEGFVTNAYGRTDVPKLIIFSTDPKSDPMKLRILFGSLGFLPFFENDTNFETLTKQYLPNIVNLYQLNEIQEVNERVKKNFIFRIANYSLFKFLWNEFIFYLGIDAETEARINAKPFDESQLSHFLISIQNEYSKQSPSRRIYPKLSILRRKEIGFSTFLLPREIKWGNISVHTVLKTIKESQRKDSEETSFWFGASLNFESKIYYLQYAFPHPKTEISTEIQNKYQNLFLNLVRPVLANEWMNLEKPLIKSGTKLLEKPILSLFENGIICEYEIHFNRTSIICHILLPIDLVNLLYTINKIEFNPGYAEPLFHLLKLNRNMIMQKFAEPFQIHFHQTAERNYPILLFEFLSMLNHNDFTLTIQNYFVANGMKTLDIQRLFFYMYLDPETKEKKLYLAEDFEEKQIVSALPAGMQKEWNQLPLSVEHKTEILSMALPIEEFIIKNREIMQSLFDLTRNGKINYSKQARYILFSEFAKLINEENQNKLSEINKTNKIIFSKLKDVPKATLQQFFYSWKTEDLGLVLLDWESELPRIQNFVSKKYYQEVNETLSAKKLLIAKSGVDIKQLILLKEKFVLELNALTSEEFV